MKRLTLIIIILVCIAISSWAQELWSISAGFNTSSFINEKDYPIQNVSIAISRDIPINNNFSIIPGIMMSGQGGLLKNKPILDENWQENLYAYDIKVSRVYMEIPLLVGYLIELDPIGIQPYTGFSYRIGLGDKSRAYNRKLVYEGSPPWGESEFNIHNVEYRFGDDEHGISPIWISSSGFGFNVGSKIQYNIFILDFRYTLSLHHVGDFGQIKQLSSKKMQIQAFHILIGIKF